MRAVCCQLLKLEKEVDKHYLNNLMNECRREKMTQRQMLQESRSAPKSLVRLVCLSLTTNCASGRWYMGDERRKKRRQAENLKMPACRELSDQGYDVNY